MELVTREGHDVAGCRRSRAPCASGKGANSVVPPSLIRRALAPEVRLSDSKRSFTTPANDTWGLGGPKQNWGINDRRGNMRRVRHSRVGKHGTQDEGPFA